MSGLGFADLPQCKWARTQLHNHMHTRNQTRHPHLTRRSSVGIPSLHIGTRAFTHQGAFAWQCVREAHAGPQSHMCRPPARI